MHRMQSHQQWDNAARTNKQPGEANVVPGANSGNWDHLLHPPQRCTNGETI